MATAVSAPGLIDTNILIDASRRVPAAMQFIVDQRSAGGGDISVISAMELVTGCRNKKELQQTLGFLNQFTIVPRSVRPSPGGLFSYCNPSFLSHSLSIPDSLIAATALESRLPLYTANVRHFQMIPALVVVRPY